MDDENKMDPVASSIEPVETKQEVPEQPKSVQDQMEELINERDAQVQEQMLEQQKVEVSTEKKKKRITIIAVVFLIIALLAAGGTLLVMNWDTWFGAKNEPVPSETVVEDTVLESGTVTVVVDGETVTYAGAYIVDGIEATISSGEYASAIDNQAVFVVVNGGSLVIDGDVQINKSGNAACDESCDKYGLNSAIVLIGDASQATIRGATIVTSASGANAVMAIDGALVTAEDVTINTTGEKSRGLYVTLNGIIEANNVTISTQGDSSPALGASGNLGSVKVEGMQLETTGNNSPLVYSAGSAIVANSTGVATSSQATMIEGDGLVELMDCDFSGIENNI